MEKSILTKVIFCMILISVGYFWGLCSSHSSLAHNSIEYKVVGLPGNPEKVETLLNSLGSAGWEFISEVNHCAVLKR